MAAEVPLVGISWVILPAPRYGRSSNCRPWIVTGVRDSRSALMRFLAARPTRMMIPGSSPVAPCMRTGAAVACTCARMRWYNAACTAAGSASPYVRS
eukprot:6308032-Lingulodinium_polyedra.AAC.1